MICPRSSSHQPAKQVIEFKASTSHLSVTALSPLHPWPHLGALPCQVGRPFILPAGQIITNTA